jgi:gamma-glutamyl:cysteine ligase YbdK (ATP-grasp superfamily)
VPGAARQIAEGSPARDHRLVGLEQEFFLVDEAGAISHRADEFLACSRDEAVRERMNSCHFKAECAKNLVEINAGPKRSLAALAEEHRQNVRLGLRVGRRLGLRLYPLGTYPLPITPVIREDLRYQIKVRTLGSERYLHAGRCAGVHLHLGLPPGTVAPYTGAVSEAPVRAREELLGLYNLATALDPALVALGRACPFYEGRAEGRAARTLHYRGSKRFGVEGVYADLPEVGALQPYVDSVRELSKWQEVRWRAWVRAMDRAGVDRRLFFAYGGTPLRASWNPVRVNRYGTVEIRSLDSN